jgi:hypothetical protein
MNGMEKFFWYAEKHGNARAIKSKKRAEKLF